MSSGGSKTTSTGTTTTEPWSGAKPYYGDLYSAGKSAFDATKGKYWTGDFYSPQNAQQTGALSGTLGLAPGQSAGAGAQRQLGLDTLNGKFLSPDSNPFIRDAVAAAMRPVTDNFQQVVLPGISDAAEQGGAYGGARMGLAQAVAAREYAQQQSDLASKIYYDNYIRERDRQYQAGGLLDEANTRELRPYQIMAQVGDAQQGFDQTVLDNARSKFNEQLSGPWAGLDRFSALLQGGSFNSQTGTRSAPTGGVGGALQGLMGGAMTGAGAGMSIGGLGAGAGLAAFAPWMLPFAALGGLAGGLL